MNDELTCSQAELLLSAYALDALEGEERCSFLAHLAECRLHDDELNAYRRVTSRLPAMIKPVAPPQELRNAVLRGFDSAVRAPAEPEPIPTTAPRRGGFGGLLRTPSFAYGLAAALAVVAIALGVFGFSRSSSTKVTTAVATPSVVNLAATDAGRTMQFSYISGQQVGVVQLNLPASAPGRAYQLWQITDAGPVSLGLVNPSGATAFKGDLSKASAIAITDEPATGSAQPTTTPFLITKL